MDWDMKNSHYGSREDLPDYRGWECWDMGDKVHPSGSRFRAMRMGVSASGGTLEQLKKSIDYRILLYPGSGGA